MSPPQSDKPPSTSRSTGGVLTFDDPAAYARSIRATALVFEDPLSRALQDRIERLSRGEATVLIIGETGTGKELVARQLHNLSARRDGAFVAINCAALPEHLIESELFGHERGAFTGALGQRKGWFETANGGTLFLDEIGDLPLGTQVKLLRVLQEREINRVGGREAIGVDLRFIAATNVPLEDAVRAGRFREDFYYRLNVSQISLPPLRDRPGDILPLVSHFLQLYQERLGIDSVALAEGARQALLNYPWPGNIRELENVVQRALLVMRDNIIHSRDFNLTSFQLATSRLPHTSSAYPSPAQFPVAANVPTPASPSGAADTLSPSLNAIFASGQSSIYASIEKAVVKGALEYCRGNQVQAAQLLGVSRNVLRHRLKLYGVI